MSKSLPKLYPPNQSPLYKIRGKGQFAAIIGVEWDQVGKLPAQSNYRVWLNKKGREIQQPIGRLEAIHRRIGALFARIELPDYLYSQAGRSYADNARKHLGDVPLVKTDIYKFYPCTTWMMVYRMFTVDFACAEDVAHRLADICCYQQKHLPTGSSVSGRIAFFASRHMFDDIASVAEREHCRMTAYVDDITISGKAATKTLLSEVRQVVHRHGLRTKQKKSVAYTATAPKPVTGAIISGQKLLLPNQRHRKIHDARRDLETVPAVEKDRVKKVLRGRLQEAKQVLG